MEQCGALLGFVCAVKDILVGKSHGDSVSVAVENTAERIVHIVAYHLSEWVCSSADISGELEILACEAVRL